MPLILENNNDKSEEYFGLFHFAISVDSKNCQLINRMVIKLSVNLEVQEIDIMNVIIDLAGNRVEKTIKDH
ncbi:hypothetical protein ACSVDA_02490 [Cytobacillus sp. Hm23]